MDASEIGCSINLVTGEHYGPCKGSCGPEEETMEHTPIPWQQHPGPYAGQPPIFGADGKMVTEYVTNDGDIPFIIRAVNNHAKLLEALKASAEKLHDLRDEPECLIHLFQNCPKGYCKDARAVIEEARK